MSARVAQVDRVRLVDFANLAPSVHNTQPARWHFASDDAIWILCDPARYLAVCDPTKRDAGLSCGAALEATILGLATFGLEVENIDVLWNRESSPVAGMDAAARLTLRSGSPSAPLAAQISDFNDRASLRFLRDRAFRTELLSWMRLRPTDPHWNLDGLSAVALGMSGIEAMGAGIVLRAPLFEALDKLGLGKAIVSERPKTVTATSIGLFHRPRSESPVVTGRAYLTMMLNLSRLGFQTWPMTAVADDAEVAAEVSRLHDLPDGHRLVSVLRIGAVPSGVKPKRARLSADRLISSEQL